MAIELNSLCSENIMAFPLFLENFMLLVTSQFKVFKYLQVSTLQLMEGVLKEQLFKVSVCFAQEKDMSKRAAGNIC